MSRVLRRPMFRIGGSVGEGIISLIGFTGLLNLILDLYLENLKMVLRQF